MAAALADTDLTFGTVAVVGTPRRLLVTVADVAPLEPEKTVVVRGPKVKAAFDADGNPTKAAEGFARSRGTTVTGEASRGKVSGRLCVRPSPPPMQT